MANTKSAAKRARQSVLRTARNSSIINNLKTQQKKFRAAVREGKKETIQAALVALSSCLDKAANKGVLHKNLVNRKKSAGSKVLASVN
jgi:small subunit ribosomal protein S20